MSKINPSTPLRIKAVFFDMDGVMCPTTIHKVARVVEQLLDLKEGLLLTQQFYFVDEIYSQMEKGEMTEKQFWRQFCRRVNRSLPDFWPTIFPQALRKDRIRIRHKMKRLVLRLKDKGIKTAVLSNISEPFARRHYRLGHYQIFDHLILSHKVGFRKPDVRIYLHALSLVKAQPHESVFIDDKEENVKVANQLGMKGIVYENTNQIWRWLEKILI